MISFNAMLNILTLQLFCIGSIYIYILTELVELVCFCVESVKIARQSASLLSC